MKFVLLLLLFVCVSCASPAPRIIVDRLAPNDLPTVIPQPMRIERGGGSVLLGPGTAVRFDSNNYSRAVKVFASEWLARATGRGSEGVGILFMTDKDEELGPEGYEIRIGDARGPDGITINANQPAGHFYGFQTLRQLLPPEAERAADEPRAYRIPAMVIRDRPRFTWRGMHLDVCRHFFSVAEVKKFLDLMALHKQNVFHWHLTEDQGWRIEIKKWPKLTEVGAWRKESPLRSDRRKGDGKRYGGFYTQKQIREVVAYAKARFITVVPEIEMPGHAQAAIAAYPWLGNVNEPVGVRTRWGVSKNVYNVEDKTFAFLEDVLREVMELFPGSYIHIGGDECPKNQWKASAKAQARMKQVGLKDEHELQSWFIRRIETFLNKNGRRLIGWDEIQEGGLAPNATMMVWRSWKWAKLAIEQGHDVVMSPTSHCYFDYYQGDKTNEPMAIGGFLPLKKVYEFEPVPDGLTEAQHKHVLGAQGNLWTEYIWDFDKLMYMAFPRACAMSEVTWSRKDRRNWEDFQKRWARHSLRLGMLDVNYR